MADSKKFCTSHGGAVHSIISDSQTSFNLSYANGSSESSPQNVTRETLQAPEDLIQSLLASSKLTSWERSFVESASRTKKRSSKQIERLEAIAARRLGGAA